MTPAEGIVTWRQLAVILAAGSAYWVVLSLVRRVTALERANAETDKTKPAA